MTSSNIKDTAKTSPCKANATTDFETGLTALIPFLRAFAQSLTGKRELAEDITQSALIKAWQSRKSFELGTNLKAWLFTILRNEFYSYHRNAWRQIPWDADLAELIPAPRNEQQWALELSDTAGAMRSLPQIQREALIMVGIGGFSYEEAATLSNRAVGTIKSRVGRARQSLKGILDGSLPIQSRPASGDAMNEMLSQLSHLGGISASRAGAGIMSHAN